MTPSAAVRVRSFTGETLSRRIATALKADILAGRLSPGDRLNEVSVADRFGVSPTPVREAVRMLVADGVVEYASRRGVRVISLTKAEIEQAFAVRVALEREALKQAFPNMTPVRCEALRALALQTGQARDEVMPVLFEIDRAFHAYLVDASGNAWLSEFAARMANVLTVARLNLFAAPDVEAVLQEHLAIADAVTDGDLPRADAALEHHIRRVCSNAVAAHTRIASSQAHAVGRGEP